MQIARKGVWHEMAIGIAYDFWKYADKYGIFDEDGCITGFRDDAPEEAKKSWKKYLQDRAKWDEEGLA